MNAQDLNKYIDALDASGRDFSHHFSKYDKVKDDVSKLKLGGEADTALAAAIKAATTFAMLLKQLAHERLPFFGAAAIQAKREKILDHAKKELWRMNRAIDSAPKSLREFAQAKMAMDEVARRM
jgi:hypothetical protein